MDEDCIFCNIAASRAPASIVYQDSKALSFMDIHPAGGNLPRRKKDKDPIDDELERTRKTLSLGQASIARLESRVRELEQIQKEREAQKVAQAQQEADLKHEKGGRGYGKGLARWERIKTDVLTIRLPRSLLDKVRQVALEDGTSLAHVFRAGMTAYLESMENPKLKLKQIERDIVVDEAFLDALAKRVKER